MIIQVIRGTGRLPSPNIDLAALRCRRRDAVYAVAPIDNVSCKLVVSRASEPTFEEILAEARAMAARAKAAAAEERAFWDRVVRGEDPKVVLFRRRYRPWHK